jgi:hypothetical protein
MSMEMGEKAKMNSTTRVVTTFATINASAVPGAAPLVNEGRGGAFS